MSELPIINTLIGPNKKPNLLASKIPAYNSIPMTLSKSLPMISKNFTTSIQPTVDVDKSSSTDVDKSPSTDVDKSPNSFGDCVLTQTTTDSMLDDNGSFNKNTSLKLDIDNNSDDSIPDNRCLNYKKIKLIGQGSGGSVYLAKYKDIDVAVKEIFIDKCDGHYEYRLNKVAQELMSHKKLSHEHVIEYIDSEIYNGIISIITCYQKHGSLYNYIKQNGQLSEHLAQSITLQLLTGLSYIHSRNIIHRDIKTSNILIAKDSIVKIADFGVSVNSEKLCINSKYFNGSLYWMAPELFIGENYDNRVDTWSLGCTIIEMITGKVPFIDEYPHIYSVYFSKIKQFTIPKTFQTVNSETIKLSEPLWIFLNDIMIIDWNQRPTCTYIMDNIDIFTWLL